MIVNRMSINPQQSWITPTTSLFSQSSFPNGIDLNGTTLTGNGTTLLIQPAKEVSLEAGQGNSALYQVSSIRFIDPVMGPKLFASLVDNNPFNTNYQLTNISTISGSNTPGTNINIVALVSTLTSVYPGCVG